MQESIIIEKIGKKPNNQISSFTQLISVYQESIQTHKFSMIKPATKAGLQALSYSQFQPFQPASRQTFKFKKLRPLSQERDIYADTVTNRKYQVNLFTNRSQVELLSELWKKGIWGNLKGLFKKKNTFYAVSDLEYGQNLGQYLQKFKGRRDQITELFCLQLIESMVQMVSVCEQLGCGVKILNPFFIILQEKEGRYTFKLRYPYCHSLFEGLNYQVVSRQAQFCAPQILVWMNKEFDLVNQLFSKSVLYSLGIVLLYCFGYRIKSQERILALKNSKQFTMFLKAIRKEIKVFHEGKFISKLIKILLQQSEEVRDNLQTFTLKLHSPQLQSLRKFVFRPQPIKDSYIPTIYSDHSEITRKSRLNRTIEIQGSSNTSNKSENSSRENIEQPRALFHYPTFRKSNDNVCQKNQEEEPSKERQSKQNGSSSQIPSPIQIKIDWEDQDAEEMPHSTRRAMSPIKKHLTDENEKSQELQIVVTAVGRDKQKFTYSEGKNRSGPQRVTRNKTQEQKWRIEQQVQNENQIAQEEVTEEKKIKNQLNEHSLVNLSDRRKSSVEEQPEIIKYEFGQNDVAHRQIKKKISNKQSVELQDMNLIEEQWEEEEQEDPQAPNTKHQQLSVQLTKKSEAIFIILLVSFLIYKVIDYVIA